MNTGLEFLSDDQLRDLRQQCCETVNAVLDRLESDSLMTATIREMLKSSAMLEQLLEIIKTNTDTAVLIFQSAIAVMVNSQSLRAIDTEIARRAIERN